MALVALKNLIRPSLIQLQPILSRSYSINEPDYLKALEPKHPLYPTVNIQIKGYDFPIVEKFQKFVHKFVDKLDIDGEESWAMPPKELHIKRYKPKSNILEVEYKLNIYERNIKVSNVSSTNLPLLIRILEASAPPGVDIVVETFDPEKELKRYIPDTDLLKLKSDLAEAIEKKE
ncbi:uncharacterized protein LOC122512528 [Leptopilina heterotoma]|uniref:uncharacterized protein LOC122512528 n=1 Tax=Leptopilina heterotoma TaxID=63436 RepID=UPI001CA8602E|nr:uncharacterized protein LOC122512528 [Leptopilina heterotoma]